MKFVKTQTEKGYFPCPNKPLNKQQKLSNLLTAWDNIISLVIPFLQLFMNFIRCWKMRIFVLLESILETTDY
jgi:hypothetical protein